MSNIMKQNLGPTDQCSEPGSAVIYTVYTYKAGPENERLYISGYREVVKLFNKSVNINISRSIIR